MSGAYTLKDPVELGDITYAELKFRTLRGKDLKRAAKYANGDPYLLAMGRIAVASDVPFTVIEAMTEADIFAALEVLENFSNGGQTTGKSSSPT